MPPHGDPKKPLESKSRCSKEALGLRDMLGRNSLRNTSWSHGSGRNHENRENIGQSGTRKALARDRELRSG